jgi:transcriptional regulator with GAF, ATPase, and Fis domain
MSTREALLADTFLRLADTLIDDFDVIETLTMLSTRCVEILGAQAAGILLADAQGRLQVMAASSETSSLLELFQVQNEEGPCLDSFRKRIPITCADLRLATPWPRFSPLAVESGFLAVHALPMVVRASVLGTMNLFMAEPGALEPADADVARALAHAATLTLLQQQAAANSHRLTAQLQGALDSRITIEQAKGVISELAQVDTDEAFVRLHSFARSHNAKLTDVALRVVQRTMADQELAEMFSP